MNTYNGHPYKNTGFFNLVNQLTHKSILNQLL